MKKVLGIYSIPDSADDGSAGSSTRSVHSQAFTRSGRSLRNHHLIMGEIVRHAADLTNGGPGRAAGPLTAESIH
jgi:hypothetical protein